MKRTAILAVFLSLLTGCHRRSSADDLVTATMFKILDGMTFREALEDQYRNALAVRKFAADQLTRWSSSTLGVPDKAPNKRTDIERMGLATTYLRQTDLDAFQLSFPEGHGPIAFRWSAMPGGTLRPGFYNFAYMDLRENIAFTDDTRRFQYAFVLDRDGDTGNNYQGQAPFDLDFFNNTDTWFQLGKTPGNNWQFSALSAINNNIVPFVSEALLLACDDVLMLMYPQDDFDDQLYSPKCRCTAFESGLDFGQNPPHDWFGSVRPERDQHLFGENWSVLWKAQPAIRIDTRFLEVGQGYLDDLGVPLDMLATYDAAPLFEFGVKTREQHDQLLGSAFIGGFENEWSFVPTGLGRGGLGANFSLSASLDYRAFVTQPGPRSFAIDDKDETAFTGNLSFDYKAQSLAGVPASMGDLFGKIGDNVLLDSVLNGMNVHVLQAPTLTLYNGQRGLVQIADSMQPIANIEEPIASEIQARFTGATEIETGYTLDFQAYVTGADKIGLQFRLDTRGVSVRPDEAITVGTMMRGIDVPIFRLGETLTSRIELDSGATLVLGGMQNQSDPNKTEGVPMLKNLPVLNQAFTRRFTDESKTLLLVITPHLVWPAPF